MSDGVRIVHNKVLGGWYVVRGPHQTPISGRFNSAAEARASLGRAARAANRRQDLDPEKRRRDLAALDPATRHRVENYNRRTHL